MTRVRCLGTGSWGTTFALVLADAGADVTCGAAGRSCARGSTAARRNPDYLADIAAAASDQGHRRTGRGVGRRGIVVLAVPSQTLRANLDGWAPLLPRERGARQPDEGHRAGHQRSG